MEVGVAVSAFRIHPATQLTIRGNVNLHSHSLPVAIFTLPAGFCPAYSHPSCSRATTAASCTPGASTLTGTSRSWRRSEVGSAHGRGGTFTSSHWRLHVPFRNDQWRCAARAGGFESRGRARHSAAAPCGVARLSGYAARLAGSWSSTSTRSSADRRASASRWLISPVRRRRRCFWTVSRSTPLRSTM